MYKINRDTSTNWSYKYKKNPMPFIPKDSIICIYYTIILCSWYSPVQIARPPFNLFVNTQMIWKGFRLIIKKEKRRKDLSSQLLQDGMWLVFLLFISQTQTSRNTTRGLPYLQISHRRAALRATFVLLQVQTFRFPSRRLQPQALDETADTLAYGSCFTHRRSLGFAEPKMFTEVFSICFLLLFFATLISLPN